MNITAFLTVWGIFLFIGGLFATMSADLARSYQRADLQLVCGLISLSISAICFSVVALISVPS